jgi:hypothetical protein
MGSHFNDGREESLRDGILRRVADGVPWVIVR